MQNQLQRLEVEKGQLEEKIQSLRTLLEAGMAIEVAISVERDQLQSCVQAKVDQVLALE